jgi:hypothetical protein
MPMRFVKIILILTVLFPIKSFGQLHVGFRGGYNISSIEFIPIKREKALYDKVLDAGLVVKYYDLQYFGFQGEVNINQRGYKLPVNDTVNFKRINTYIEVPIFTQVRAAYKGFFVHFNVGVSASYLLKAVEGNNEEGKYAMSDYKINILRDNRFDYGLIGGLGIGHNFKWGTIQLEARYHYGLGDLFYHNYEGNPLRSPHRIQSISLSYLYNFSNFFKRSEPLHDLLIGE